MVRDGDPNDMRGLVLRMLRSDAPECLASLACALLAEQGRLLPEGDQRFWTLSAKAVLRHLLHMPPSGPWLSRPAALRNDA